jgi:hypothetical protein
VLVAVGVVVACLLVVGTLAHLLIRGRPDGLVRSLARLFLLDEEQSLPTWYSSLQLLMVAPMLLAAGAASGCSRGLLMHWRLLALVFVGLAIDEAIQIHEMGDGLMRSFGAVSSDLSLWVVPGALFAAAVAAYAWPLLRSQPPSLRRLWLLAGVLYLGGAVGIETLAHRLYERAIDDASTAYVLLVGLEEGLEMAGVVVMISALARYLSQRGATLSLSFSPSRRPPRAG